MKRDVLLFIDDILESIKNIEDFTKGINKEKFSEDKLRQSAVIRQLGIIGEAVKNIPNSFKSKYPKLEWKDIAGTRDILIHAYFEVDIDKVWKVIAKDLADLEKKIKEIKDNEESNTLKNN